MKPADSETEIFLQDFHRQYPSCTSSFLRGFDPEGRTSYERLIRKLPASSGLRILDLACGDGTFVGELQKSRRDLEVVGLDMSEGELEVARRRSFGVPVDFIRGKAQALPFPEESFDAVFCHMAFMLMDEAERVLSEVRRVLKRGGIFSAVVGAAGREGEVWSDFQRLLKEAMTEEKTKTLAFGDPRARSEEGLQDLLRKAGFASFGIENAELRFKGPVAEMLEFFLLTYNVGFLSPKGREEFRGKLEDAFSRRMDAEGNLRYRMNVLHLTALN